jgi:hypothetical protein
MIKYIKQLLNAESPESSKRLIGLIGALSLITAMFIFNTDILVQSVLILSTSSLGFTTLEKVIPLFKK